MKQQIVTTGIVLSRTDYGEADRIITVLTPDYGKLSMMARGVRKSKSKLAGGIELFSTSNITFMEGMGEIGTLISSRLLKYYSNIVNDIERVQTGYSLIKLLNKATEDHPGPEYYELMVHTYAALDNAQISLNLLQAWFQAQLLRMAGHTPNLRTDSAGNKLQEEKSYNFNIEDMVFTAHEQGRNRASQIRTLRILFQGHSISSLGNITGLEEASDQVSPLIKSMLSTHIRT